MARPLRGERYAKDPRASRSFPDFLVNTLPYLDYSEAMAFYAEWIPKLSPPDVSLLGCNDRFFLLTGLCNRVDMFHPWLYERAREVEAEPDGYLDLWARWHYKAIDVDEEVLTPHGWRKHGDLRPGDQVFGPDGKPARVIAKTPVFTDADCYRVSFCDGYSVVASGDHLWTVEIPSRARINGTNKRQKCKTVTLNTRDLRRHVEEAARIKSRRFPIVPVAAPLQIPARDLPLDPYVLGAWLGDGSTGGVRITAGSADAEEMAALLAATGVAVKETKHSNAVSLRLGVGRRGDRTSSDVANALRAMGVYRNKRIPVEYMMAAEHQRLALLQGLMDTDGSCAKSCGQAIYSTANERLARDVFDLAQSLGFKATIAKRIGNYYGQAREFWHVQFLGRADRPPFRLSRKVTACVAPQRAYARKIVSIEPVPSRPVSCIQVDRPDGLYLVGRHLVTTHNSTIITFGGCIQEILCDPEITIGIFSNSIKISRPFLSQIKDELEGNEALKSYYPDVLWQTPRKEAPSWSLEGGITVKRKSNPKEATVEAHGLIDAMPTGRHFKLLIYDDIINEKNVTNPDQIKKATERVELSDNLGSGEHTRKWFIGTRYHFGDSYAHLLEHDIVKPRIHPATDDGTLNGNPVFMSPAAWEARKKAQRSTIAAQMLQNPIAGKENTFQARWLRPYWVRPAMLNVYIMADPSLGRSASSDRTAIAVVGIDTTANKYLIDGYCHRMPLSERWRHLRELYHKWRNLPGVQLIKVGYERYGQQSDLEYFEERMRIEGVRFDIEELNWTGNRGQESKNHRIQRLEPDFRNEKFFVPGKVWHPAVEGNVARWWVEDGSEEIHYEAMPAPHRLERQMRLTGEMWRLFEPIRRIDEDGNVYDLTRVFFEEFRFHPFSPRDDLIDVMSRIYDMEPSPAVRNEVVHVEQYID